jgi:hypothetical protein
MSVDEFTDAARFVATAARRAGLVAPGFRGRWDETTHRILRVGSTSVTVYVDLHRPADEVIDALIEGCLAANRRQFDDPVRADLDPRT